MSSWPIDINKIDLASEIGFGRPEKQTLKQGATPITYHRIPIFQLSKSGTGTGPPVPTGRSFTLSMPSYLFCLGIEEKRGMNDTTGPKTKATLALCMHSRPQATAEEREWVKKYLEIIEICKKHVISIGETIREDGIAMGDMQKGFHSMNIPYLRDPSTGLPVKDKDGRKIEDTSKRPYFNPEVKTRRTDNGELEYVSKFRHISPTGIESIVDPHELVREGDEKKQFEVSCTVDLDNIYIGQSNISVRWKLRDAYVSFIVEEPFATKPPPPRNVPSVASEQGKTPLLAYASPASNDVPANANDVHANAFRPAATGEPLLLGDPEAPSRADPTEFGQRVLSGKKEGGCDGAVSPSASDAGSLVNDALREEEVCGMVKQGGGEVPHSAQELAESKALEPSTGHDLQLGEIDSAGSLTGSRKSSPGSEGMSEESNEKASRASEGLVKGFAKKQKVKAGK